MNISLLDEITLAHGSHGNREDGVCAMEAVAWMAGEPHSDSPQCTCPVIARLVRSWNDCLSEDDRQRVLKPLLPLLIGTRATPEVEGQRAYMALDWLVRTHTAAWLRLAKLSADADALRALPAIADHQAALAAGAVVAAAGAAACDAAWAAARAAACDAAMGAARDAAMGAARDAAMGAARAAAVAAAWAAACDAARAAVSYPSKASAVAALRPTVLELQENCCDLLRRMCEVR